jgi:hypothetical protein
VVKWYAPTHRFCLVVCLETVARPLTAVLLIDDVEPLAAATTARDGVRSMLRWEVVWA